MTDLVYRETINKNVFFNRRKESLETDTDLLLTDRLLLTNDSSIRLFLLRSRVSRLGRPEKSCAVTMVTLFSFNANKWR